MTYGLNRWLRGSAAFCVAAASLGFASSASACGYTPTVRPAALQAEGASGLGGLFHQASADNSGNHKIVGLWSFTMTAGGNTIDFGYQTWHDDGTELLNSGGRAPSTENFCMGVWKQTGASTYHLHHIALSYTPAGDMNAKVIITEDVTLESTNHFSGTFTLDVRTPDGNTSLQTISGNVSGDRVQP